MKNDDFLQLRISYIEIGKLLQKYGHGQYNAVLKILMSQVKCIDSDEDKDEKSQYLIESYKRLFISRGGLCDFIIYDENNEVTNQLNEKLNEEVKNVWRIIKNYI